MSFHTTTPTKKKQFSPPISDGMARLGTSLFTELRNVVFSRVAQKAIRQVAKSTFLHLLSLDLSFHTSRQSGGLARAIDRGTRYLLSDALYTHQPHPRTTKIQRHKLCANFDGVQYRSCGI